MSCRIIFHLFILFPTILLTQSSSHINTAIKISNWLETMEVSSENSGVSWKISSSNSMSQAGIDKGAAGIGLFYLKLYKNTSNTDYLIKAGNAAKYIRYYLNNIGEYGPDWISGAAGMGYYFLQLFDITKDSLYLNYAKERAEWLSNQIYEDETGLYYWKHYPNFPKIYTGYAHGAAGIGDFFLDLYSFTNSEEYLNIAKGAYKWIRTNSIKFDDNSIGFKRLTKDNYVYHLWCGGTVGIIFFLEKLYNLTNDDYYKNEIVLASNGLVKYAKNKGENGKAWNYSSNGGNFPVPYCHGTSSVALSLFHTHLITNEHKYFDYAVGGMEWLKMIKKNFNNDFYFWPHIYGSQLNETGLLTGTASVGYSFLLAHNYNPIAEYLEYGKIAADFLNEIADKPTDNQLRWLNYFESPYINQSEIQYETGWYSGAAGIGIFFLELAEKLTTVDVEESKDISIKEFKVFQNYPNPFNPTTNIKYSLPVEAFVKFNVFNVAGQKVDQKELGFINAGMNELLWDASKLPSGIYFYKITATNVSQNFSNYGKMIFLK